MDMDWKQRITRGWTLFRIIRFALSVFILIQAWKSSDWFIGLIGSVLLFQSLWNPGCCGIAGCETKPLPNEKALPDNKSLGTGFEEIK